MTTPREKYERRRETFNEYVEDGVIDSETGEAVRELCDAYDDHNVMMATPEDEGTREVSTLMSWLYRLMAFAQERDLTTATADELKRDIQDMHDGSHPQVKDGGIQKSTLRSYQAALRKFYTYHDGFEVDPDDIPMFDQEASPVDPNDMLTKEEIQEAREAAGNPRDRLIFDLLLYTGQRREALRTLRLKDVDAEDGTYRLNPTVEGLKGATKRNGNRPLLGARGAVQNWLEYHPDTSDPDNYLITARPGYSAVDPSEPVTGETIRRVMAEIKKNTSIEKPMHPHALRHNFVTIAKRDYDLADDTIKYLIGHSADSTVMETTYSHLSGDDHVKRAEEAWGIREPEEESILTPDVCKVCGNPLEPNAKACSRCGTVYTPDANEAQNQMEEQAQEAKERADTLEEYKDADKIAQAIDDDPKLAAELMDKLGELSEDD
ncbi:tyrosine-type recombinase/integrase [Halapricum hydrolyticum]|uniref:Site-specific integrase n=1 Tax=Halapricum hydrolyticum TaxID=2979991 RepID=A0AAE3IFW5_9EURY|nr:tyrosine-type recombinase/integrase [Halapricum hydrolyticum]MCU4718888.1 site-specific integrase [Halapricum hydrolyticum]MCU4727834.1 site-specific integrase [Halapricum hydrolyticum]